MEVRLTRLKKSGLIELSPGVVYIAKGIVGHSHEFETSFFYKGQRSPRLSITLPAERSTIRPGLTYSVEISEIKEVRVFKVTEASKEPAIRIHKRKLWSLGLRPEDGVQSGRHVVELNVKGRGANPKRIYTNHKRGYCRVTVLVGRIAAKVGDYVEVLEAREYTLENFLSDYNRFKPETLPNLISQNVGDVLIMRFLDKETSLLCPILSAHYSTVVLSARLGCTKTRIAFSFDGETILAWLYKSKRITKVSDSK